MAVKAKVTRVRDPFGVSRMSNDIPPGYVVNPINLGFTPAANPVGYTGSGWNYGGGTSQTFKPASQARLAVAPAVQPIGHNPFDALITQAKQWAQNPNQLRTAANQQVSAQVKAALGASDASSKAEQQQLQALEGRAAGFAQALAGMQAPGGQQVYDQYIGAANTLANLGGGLTGAVASDQQAAADQATAAIRQQLGGSANVQGYDPNALRSAAYYTGVTLPGSTLAQQAISQANQIRSEYVAGSNTVDQTRRDYEAQAVQALNQRAAERASIVAQQPALFQDALKANRDDQAQVQAHLDSLTTNKVNWQTNAEKMAYQKQQDKIVQKQNAAKIASNNKAIAAKAKMAADALTAKNVAAAAGVAEKEREFDAHQKYLNHLADIQEMGMTHIGPNGKLVGGYVYDPKTKAIVPSSVYYGYMATGETNATRKAVANATNKTRANIANATNATRVKTAGMGANATVNAAKIRSDAQRAIADANNATRDADSRRRYNAAVIKANGKKALGGLSATGFTSLQNQALKKLDTIRYGVPGGQRKTADGTAYEADPTKPPIPGLDYNQALIQLGEMGPATPAWENYVLAVVNNAYTPGENGRPLTAAGQAWLSRRMLQAAQKFGKNWGGLPPNFFLQGPVK